MKSPSVEWIPAGSFRFLLGAVIGLSPATGTAADISLDRIRDLVAEQATSIRSLSVQMTVIQRAKPPIADPPETSTVETTWVRSGTKLLHMTAPRPAKDGRRAQGGRLEAFDGQWTQSAVRDPTQPDKLLQLQRYRGWHISYLQIPLLEFALGHSVLSAEGTLADLLANPAARVIGEETVDGASCVKVEVSPHKGQVFDLMKLTVWLDPGQAWLPRKLVSEIHPDSSVFAKQREAGISMTDEIRVAEFRSVADPQQGTSRPFPWKIQRKMAFLEADVDMHHVELNTKVSDSRFVIAPTTGTEVVEGVAPQDAKARRWVHGGPAVRDQIRKERVEQAKKQAAAITKKAAELNTGKPPINASPKLPGNGLAWGAALAAIGFAALAIWFRMQHG